MISQTRCWLSSLALSLLLSSSSLAQDASSAWTPSSAPCSSGFELVRLAGNVSNQTLSPSEVAYVSARSSQVLPGAWKSYLQNVQSTNVTLPDYLLNALNGSGTAPKLGIATSGGGYRAAIFGAGVLNALDDRNSSSQHAGTAGLLQAATYLSGLSGGSWLVTSFAQANFPPIQKLVFGSNSSANESGFGGWNAQFDINQPNNNTAEDTAFIGTILGELAGKFKAGYPLSVNDVWSRLLSRHFVNGTSADDFFSNSTTHGAGILFSDIANVPAFANHSAPFPIIVADSKSTRENASTIMSAAEDFIPLTDVIYEFNPYEMGSFDPMLSAFAPTKFLGSRNSSVCVTGYDQAAFVLGTSSELYNEFNTSTAALLNSSVGPIISALNITLPQSSEIELDLALYPNPFFGVSNSTYIDTDQQFLGLVDGGEDGQVVPLQPLLAKARGVDVIIAIDATNDVNNYAAGSSLVATQNRTNFVQSYSFPPVPTNITTFVEQNLASQPTFFGCNESSPTPLVIYLANGAAPPGLPHLTNTTTDQTTYLPAQIQGMLDQTFIIATQGITNSSTADPQWPACLACAVVDRARNQSGTARSGVCSDCFTRYCWNGTDSILTSPSKSMGVTSFTRGSTFRVGLVAAVVTALVSL